jgi:hypothetical protein
VARIQNTGSSTTLARWELTIELPDRTIIQAQKWPPTKTIRILCEHAPITISRDQYLDVQTRRAVQRTEERTGVTVWMVKNIPLRTLETTNATYTLTAKDNTGVAHALENFRLPSSGQSCSGFDVLD